MEKILINIDKKTKEDFQRVCKQFGVSMTTVIVAQIKKFNKESVTTKEK